jgi:hypothetical protein
LVVAVFVAVVSAFVAVSAALFCARAGIAAEMLPASNAMVENRILIPPAVAAYSIGAGW